MNPQQLVIKNAKRRVLIARDATATTQITTLHQARELVIPYNVFDLHYTAIATESGAGLSCYIPAEQFTHDFGHYNANTEGGILVWMLDRIQKTIDQRLAFYECILTAQLPEYPDSYPEYFRAQLQAVQDPLLEFRTHTKLRNRLVHWTNFFENSDPVRQQVHRAYQDYHRQKKQAS